jgi:hypothetical protein
MAAAAEHSRRYRARRHDDEIVPWSRRRRDSPKLMPHGTAAETATPQQVYFRLHYDDALIAKP